MKRKPDRSHWIYSTLFRSRQRVLPNRNAGQNSNAPVLAGSENILRPRCFEDSARSLRLFPPILPGSISVALANGQHFCRTVFDADWLWVCAQAFPNFPGKTGAKTRGITSCLFFKKHRKTLKVTDLLLALELTLVRKAMG